MKKALSLLLTLALATSLAACGGSNGSSTAQADDSQQATGEAAGQEAGGEDAPAPEVDGDIYEIVIQFPTLGTTPAGLQDVEDAINARVESELGVHITFYPVSAFDINSTTNLMVSSGEKLDLMISMFEGGVSSYVNKGILLELDDLVEQYGQGIVAAEGIAMSGGYFDGKLYAVPTEEKMGRVKAFKARVDLLEKYDIEYDENHIYTYDELEEIFATVKEGEGSGFYAIAANPNDDDFYWNFDPVDFLGASLASGALLDYGMGDDTIVNYYATENYKQACDYARQWYLNGYFAPDANTATDAGLTQMQSGNYLGFFENSEPDMVLNQSITLQAHIGTDVVPLYTSHPFALTQCYQITLWAMPITCDNPEKTMQFLNMMYSDKDLINLMYFGVEGLHWDFVEGSTAVIDYAEGIDAATTPYPPLLNVWGDKSQDYVMSPIDESYYGMLADFNASIRPEHTSQALGYCFNSDPVKTQYAALTDVINQYQASLGMGVVDPDEVLPEFLAALEAAGIDEVIAENQRQFDEWKANQ